MKTHRNPRSRFSNKRQWFAIRANRNPIVARNSFTEVLGRKANKTLRD